MMELAAFKARYPSFVDDAATQLALDDAAILLTNYNISSSQVDLATAYLTAHLLTLPTGASEARVTKVKADTVEVQFSDKQTANDWLNSTSYGKLFLMLVQPKTAGIGVMVV